MTSKDNNPVFRKEINALLDNINVVDAWRVQNPNIRRYTHNKSCIFYGDHITYKGDFQRAINEAIYIHTYG